MWWIRRRVRTSSSSTGRSPSAERSPPDRDLVVIRSRSGLGIYRLADEDWSYRVLASDVVPATVRRFVEGHFDSVTAVEVLLLLRESPRALSSHAVARKLRIDPDQTEGILSGLDRSGLVRRRGLTFEYGPRDEEAAGAVETLAKFYSGYRYRIIGIIFTKHHP